MCRFFGKRTASGPVHRLLLSVILRDPRNIPTRTAYPCVFAVGKWEILLGETPIRTCSLVFYPRGSYCREIYFGGDRAIPVGEAGASRARGPSETSEGTQPEVFPGSSIIDGTTMVIFVRSSPPYFPVLTFAPVHGNTSFCCGMWEWAQILLEPARGIGGFSGRDRGNCQTGRSSCAGGGVSRVGMG